MKGFYKGVKYISQIFVVKEQEFELEIGYPTDVKHVAHIGADGLGGAPPSWMNEFKAGPDFSAPTLGSFKEKKSIKSKDINQSSADSPTAQKKHRRRKSKSTTSSPKATSRHSRTSRPKGTQILEV
ncbi:hypothetical protein QQ045_029443 [Rhodiola kirilowii]